MTSYPINRRLLVGCAALGCFSAVSADVLAQLRTEAARVGKPLLTEASLNAVFPRPNDPLHRSLLLEAANDPRAFVRSRFMLSSAQEAELASISAADLALLQRTLRTAANENRPVTFSFNANATARTTPQQLVSGDAKGLSLDIGLPAPVNIRLRPLEPPRPSGAATQQPH